MGNTVTAATLTESNQQNNAIPIDAGRKARKAYPSDVLRSDLSAAARLVYVSLCNHADANNEAWPKVRTIAKECGFSEPYGSRTAQRGLAELENKGWICLPKGNAGGPRKGTLYHLHPDGKPCALPKTEPMQKRLRPDVSANNKKRWAERRAMRQLGHTDDKMSSVTEAETLKRDDKKVIQGMTSESSTDDKKVIAYKEEPSLRTISKEPSPPSAVQRRSKGGAETKKVIPESSSREVSASEHKLFDEWEDKIAKVTGQRGAKIEGQLRREIKAVLASQGHSIWHMNEAFDFGLLEGWRKWRVGLVKNVREFHDQYGHVKFPACFRCKDAGTLEKRWTDYPELGLDDDYKPKFCNCDSGQRLVRDAKRLDEMALSGDTDTPEYYGLFERVTGMRASRAFQR